jgi:hypothetical protein
MFLRVFFLAFLIALDIDAAKECWRMEIPLIKDAKVASRVPPARPSGLPVSDRESANQMIGLPNSCELIATEALRRMERAHVWCRILIIRYGDKYEAHALCVFQPHWQICVYDDTGSVELDTNSHDPNAIANLLAIRLKRPIESARFLR